MNFLVEVSSSDALQRNEWTCRLTIGSWSSLSLWVFELDQVANPVSTNTNMNLWRRNCASVAKLSHQVVEVLEDQARRGQVIVLPEEGARARFPNLTISERSRRTSQSAP